jgi:hypothetical protein
MRIRTWILIAAATLVAAAGLTAVGRVVWLADLNRQPHVDDSIGAMDTAVASVLTAAGDRAATAISGMVRSTTCTVGTLRHPGGDYTRAADLVTDAGTESDLLSRVAVGLSSRYAVQQVSGGQALDAGVGHGVHLHVYRLGDGWLTVQASTDCVIGPGAVDPTPTPLTGPAEETITNLLSHLGTRAAETHIDNIRCSHGGESTAVAISEPTNSAGLADRLQGALPADAHPYRSTANRVAFRDGSASVIVAASDDATEVSVRYTQPC